MPYLPILAGIGLGSSLLAIKRGGAEIVSGHGKRNKVYGRLNAEKSITKQA